MKKPDSVNLINGTAGAFWICGLASELWPVLIDRLLAYDTLTENGREIYDLLVRRYALPQQTVSS